MLKKHGQLFLTTVIIFDSIVIIFSWLVAYFVHFNTSFGPALRYARLVAQNDPVDDATAQTLREQLGPKVLVEPTVLVGYYGMLARVLNTLRVPLEEGVEAIPFVINA